jgi:hypothetical protein
MRQTSEDTDYHHQNLWMIDERLTFHSLITSDTPLNKNAMLNTDSEKRGDIVIFDEKIIFGDVRADENPINSITTIEFKRPGRNDYNDSDNPVRQAFRLINDIRSGIFKINGRSVSVANDKIPATAYCICDITPSLTAILADLARSMRERSTSEKRRCYCSRFDCGDAGWAGGIDPAAAGSVVCVG